MAASRLIAERGKPQGAEIRPSELGKYYSLPCSTVAYSNIYLEWNTTCASKTKSPFLIIVEDSASSSLGPRTHFSRQFSGVLGHEANSNGGQSEGFNK